MCKIMEGVRNEGINVGKKDMVIKMLKKDKYTLEDIADISGMTLDEVKKLRDGRMS